MVYGRRDSRFNFSGCDMKDIRIVYVGHDIEVREYFNDTYILVGTFNEISNDWAHTMAQELKTKLEATS